MAKTLDVARCARFFVRPRPFVFVRLAIPAADAPPAADTLILLLGTGAGAMAGRDGGSDDETVTGSDRWVRQAARWPQQRQEQVLDCKLNGSVRESDEIMVPVWRGLFGVYPAGGSEQKKRSWTKKDEGDSSHVMSG